MTAGELSNCPHRRISNNLCSLYLGRWNISFPSLIVCWAKWLSSKDYKIERERKKRVLIYSRKAW